MHTHRFGKGAGGMGGGLPMKLIRGMAKGEGFIRQVQAFMFLETFPETFL